MKYSLDEITNHLHCIFIDEDPTETAKYAAFRAGLKAGRYVIGEFLRFDELKNPVWLEARATRS